MDNIKGTITKKKTFKKVLCYFSLVILVALLFLPMALRIVYRDKKDDTPKNVVEILSCEKEGESISSTFKNTVPYNLLYKVKRDLTNDINNSDIESVKVDEETVGDEKKEESTETSFYSPLLNKIRAYSSFSYDEVNVISSFSVNLDNLIGSDDYDLIFININNQEYYYTSLGFSCSRKTI